MLERRARPKLLAFVYDTRSSLFNHVRAVVVEARLRLMLIRGVLPAAPSLATVETSHRASEDPLVCPATHQEQLGVRPNQKAWRQAEDQPNGQGRCPCCLVRAEPNQKCADFGLGVPRPSGAPRRSRNLSTRISRIEDSAHQHGTNSLTTLASRASLPS